VSVYRPRKKDGSYRSSIFIYDFWLKPAGKAEPERFQGPTGQKTRSAALKAEARFRELAVLGKLSEAMTLADACERYLAELLDDPKKPKARQQQELCMSELQRFLGSDTPLVSITPDDVSKAAQRRAQTPVTKFKRIGNFVRKRDRLPGYEPQHAWRETDKLPTPATVNRQFIEPLRRVLRRAKKQWGVPLDLDQFTWGGRDGVKRTEPAGRVRELSTDEDRKFWHALDPAYADLCELYIISGKRQAIWLGLTKNNVNLASGTITTRALKKRRPEIKTTRMTERELEIVARAYAESPEGCNSLFTAISKSPRDRKARIPITPRMLRSKVQAACATAGINDFKPHDFRHTFGSRLMRDTGNLKLTQEAMEHASITSTLRYTHVQQDEILEARARLSVARNIEPEKPAERKRSA